MIKKRNHIQTMRLFLWSAFCLNLIVSVLSIVWKFPILISGSIIFSLLIINLHNKIKIYYSPSNFLKNRNDEDLSFYMLLNRILCKREEGVRYLNEINVVKISIHLSSTPDYIKHEEIVHRWQSVKLYDRKNHLSVGSDDEYYFKQNPKANASGFEIIMHLN